MAKIIFIFLFTIFGNSICAKSITNSEIKKALIERQVVSSRCEGLIREHNRYLHARQKVFVLQDINLKLKVKNTKKLKDISRRLRRTKNLLIRELDYLQNTLIGIEEQIVHLGCPGITL